MISIIIPTYNYICTNLVKDLVYQAKKLKDKLQDNFDYEIIVAEDGSNNIETITENRKIQNIPHCLFFERKNNVGRACLRNWLIEQSRFNYLLLIDSDASVCKSDFIEKYWYSRHQADFICGGLRNPNIKCPKGCELRYRYEHQAEKKRGRTNQNLSPHLRLSTFNLFINKERLGTLRFDTRCKEYGYEDALLGLELKERGYTVKHINNPLIHNGIDTNESFLQKTEAAMRTLSGLEGIMQQYAGTSRAYRLLQKFHLRIPFIFLFTCTQRLIRNNLLSHHPSLSLFQLYKLGYYSNICK